MDFPFRMEKLVLAIGDFHIPYRASHIPAAFKKLLVPGKVHHVIALGNYTHPEIQEWLTSLAPHIHWVQGQYDAPTFPLMQHVTIENLRIGALHGHTIVPRDDPEILAATARQINVDVLITGDSGWVDCYEYESRLYVNPGSATGITMTERTFPSFILMDVVGTHVTAYVYQLGSETNPEEMKINKLEFDKPMVES